MKHLIFLFIFFSNLTFARLALDLRTQAEKSQWKNTGRVEETVRLCKDFARKFPKRVQCLTYGKTPEGRDLYYMLVGENKAPVVWVQAGIHAGEIDGKDAVFWLLRDILEFKIKPDPLKGLRLAFIPIVNWDGHERFGPWNRPNQVGPEEMGWRTTAQNLNLNRDFMKMDAPEMRSLIKIWNKLQPVMSLDLHVTDGAQFQPEVGLIVLPNTYFGTTPLHQAGKKFEEALLAKMQVRGRMALPYYPSFEKEDDPSSGFAHYVTLPRFANGYWYNNHRLGMLVETHSWKDYATRVKTHYETVLSTLEIAQVEALQWKKIEKQMDSENSSGTKVELEFSHTEKSHIVEFPGYKYTKEKSTVSGEEVIKYDPSIPEIWKVPFYDELKPSLIVEAPKEGYFIPVQYASWIVPKLKIHGINYFKLNKNKSELMNVFRATKKEFSVKPYEGHQTLKVEGEWKEEKVELLSGAIYVPIHQPKGRIVLHLFEPRAQDSFLAWGFFNRAFEQKEYMENYVTDVVAKEMLKNPEIKAEFEAKLKADAEFAKDARKRFEFFYRKHPSWDERMDKYPVLKR